MGELGLSEPGTDKPCRTDGLRTMGMLAALQQADSFFPSGAMAFSWGLEALRRDGIVHDAATLAGYIESQVLQRWASCDQGLLSAACAAAGNADGLDAVLEIDALAEAISVVAALRDGACRLGRTLVSVHSKLGQGGATALLRLIETKRTPGHLAVVQGYVWAGAGMSEFECRAASAHATCTGAASAALRLGLVGHLDAQRALTGLHARLAPLLEAPPPPLDQLSSCAFAIDIAALRHAQFDARMFAN
jgi:urease accessory protein